MIKTEFVQDADDYAANLVAAAARWTNRPYEHVQRLFVVARIERSEGLAEIWNRCPFEPYPGRQSFGRKAAVDVPKDLESVFAMTPAVEHAGELEGGIGVARLELQGRAERLLIALLSQHFRLRWEE